MAKYVGKTFHTILEQLEAGVAPKVIAYTCEVPYQTVLTIKNAFFDTVLVRKKKLPDPNQGSFFHTYWRRDRQ